MNNSLGMELFITTKERERFTDYKRVTHSARRGKDQLTIEDGQNERKIPSVKRKEDTKQRKENGKRQAVFHLRGKKNDKCPLQRGIYQCRGQRWATPTPELTFFYLELEWPIPEVAHLWPGP
jgi:hypothetical protein